MSKQNLRIISICAVFAVLALAVNSAPTVIGQGQSITILHNNDLESALLPEGDEIGGLARIANFVNNTRATEDRVLLLSGGDNILAGDFFNFFLGEATYKGMSAAGYDVSGLGNHEFDRGEGVLADALTNYATFPYVASNLELGSDSPLAPLTQPFTSTTISALRNGDHGGMIYDGLLVDYDGLNVCMFGLLDQAIEEGKITQLAPTTHITDPVAASQRLVDECEANGADLVIAMLHLAAAIRVDTQVKNAVAGVDVFVAGGTDALFDPEANPDDNVVETASGPSLSVQGDGDGNAIGKLDLTVDGGQIVDFTYENLEVDASFGEDPDVAALVNSFESQVATLLNSPAGVTFVGLDGVSATNRQRETNIGSYITDCFRREFPQIEIAMHNGGGIRASAPAGSLTFRDVQAITPFGNTLVLMNLTGAQVLEMLENAISNVEGTQGRYAQLSGLEFAYDITQAPGERVIAGTVFVNGAALDEGQSYRVGTLNFLAAGGDGYAVFTEGQNVIDTTTPQDALLTQCIQDDSAESGGIAPVVTGRVTSKIGWLEGAGFSANEGQEVNFRGTVTYAQDANAIYVQESINGIRVVGDVSGIGAGDFVDVTGTLEAGQISNATVTSVAELEFTGEAIRFNVQPHTPISVRLEDFLEDPSFYDGALVGIEQVSLNFVPGQVTYALSDLVEGNGKLNVIVNGDEVIVVSVG